MMTKGIEYSPEPPTMTLPDGKDFTCTGGDRLSADRVRIFRDQEHAHGTTAERLRTEVQVAGRFISNPELGTTDGQLRDDRPVWTIHSVKFDGTERFLVEVDRASTISHRQGRRDESSEVLC